jgi:hypothetical protein
MKLSEEQRLQLEEYAATGLMLESCLLCMGLGSEAIEELLKEPHVSHAWNTGRARGAMVARQQLAEEARNGNVSAMSKLKLFDTDEKKEAARPRVEQLSSAERKARAAAWWKDFNERWERFRQIHEAAHANR